MGRIVSNPEPPTKSAGMVFLHPHDAAAAPLWCKALTPAKGQALLGDNPMQLSFFLMQNGFFNC
jgi:hypothetical protein